MIANGIESKNLVS